MTCVVGCGDKTYVKQLIQDAIKLILASVANLQKLDFVRFLKLSHQGKKVRPSCS